MRSIGTPREESVRPVSYLELQTIGDDRHHHGLRRYAAGHYLTELADAAIDALLTRGVTGGDGVDWSRVAAGGFQAYGGAIGEVSNGDSAFSHRPRRRVRAWHQRRAVGTGCCRGVPDRA